LAQQGAQPNSSGVWLDVPFVKQSVEGCGSASLAMLLQYWSVHGTAVAPERAEAAAIQKQLYSRKAHGIFASDMERYLRESGFREFAVRGEWDDLREHLQKGRPLILSMRPGGGTKAPLHYVVVTGMDWQLEAVFINDPARGKLLRIERTEFEKEWLAASNWMLLAVPAGAN
jgi:ABC-type bacteriocin/lantibiotic exporter with double-glycine peptidase domain